MPLAATAATFQVFLSHNSRDKATVERLALKLKRDGIEPWLDTWNLTPGGRWQEEIAEGLSSASACAVCIGPHDVGGWGREELAVASNRAATDRGFRLFLVLLPGLSDQFDADALSPFLSTRTWVDLRRGVDDRRGFQALINAVRGIPLGPGVPIEPREGVCPYRGLRPFEEGDAEFFFGRDAEIQRLLEKLKASGFLAVVGASGSGKSSLVRAGLVPELRNGAIPESQEWRIVTLKPGAHPLDTLAGHLAAEGLRPAAAAAARDELAADPRALRLIGAAAPKRMVWIIDQFEEVFTLCREESEREHFIGNLLHAATAGGPSLVIVALRADFYPRCASFPELAQQVAAHQVLVTAMDSEGLRQAIEEPAARVGLTLEPGLTDTLLGDVSAQPGALPLLEHALLELWERRRGDVMTLEGYRETGGVDGAVAKRAEAVFGDFDSGQQAIVRRAFLRLTQPGAETQDTKRRARIAELATSAAEQDSLDEVIRALTANRMLTAGVEGDGERWVDISHEALLRAWPRLRSWLDEDRAGRRIHRRVSEATHEWCEADRDDALLFRGVRLAETVDWSERQEDALNDREREFLAASVALREREHAEAEERAKRERQLLDARRRTRRMRAGLVIGICLALTLPLLAIGRPDLNLERDLVNARLKLHPRPTATDRLVLVGLDDRSLEALGGWPIRRHHHARVIDRLRRSGAAVIGYDIQFSEPSENLKDDYALVDAIDRANHVVLATTEDPAAIFGGHAKEYGAVVGDTNLKLDTGLVTHIPPGVTTRSFGLRLADEALGHRTTDPPRARIDFPYASGRFPVLSFLDVARGRIPPETFRGKVVLVGATSPALQDIHNTPVGKLKGIEIQASVAETALRGFPLRDVPRWLDLLITALVGLAIPVTLLTLSPSRALVASLAIAALFAVAAQLAFNQGHIITMLYALTALLVSALAAFALQLRRRHP